MKKLSLLCTVAALGLFALGCEPKPAAPAADTAKPAAEAPAEAAKPAAETPAPVAEAAKPAAETPAPAAEAAKPADAPKPEEKK